MTTLYVSHPASFDHEVPEGHPERPARMRAVERALEDERFAGLVRASAPRADLDTAALAHPRSYVDALAAAVPEHGMVSIDSDTILSPGSLEATLRAMPQVEALHSVSGVYDMIVEVAAGSIEELDRVLDDIGLIDGVERTTSSIILSTRIRR